MNVLLRRLGLLLVMLLLAAYAAVVLRGPNGLTALAARRQAIRELQEKNASLEADNKRKRERIELLKHNRETQDLEIREKLKLVRPGEEQVILDGDAPNPPAPAAPTK
jgi:cell division protein FtsB